MFERCLAMLALAPLLAAQTGPGVQQPPFKSDLLDNMLGFWTITGTLGNRPVMEVADAEWVLGHQFLRLHRKEIRGPLETVMHIGFDTYNRRLVAIRVDSISALGAETPGFGLQDGNKIEFTYNYPTVPFRETWTWDPAAKSWQILIESKDRKTNAWNTVSNLTMKRGGFGGRGFQPAPPHPPAAPAPPASPQ